jgi:hypothetical protein
MRAVGVFIRLSVISNHWDSLGVAVGLINLSDRVILHAVRRELDTVSIVGVNTESQCGVIHVLTTCHAHLSSAFQFDFIAHPRDLLLAANAFCIHSIGRDTLLLARDWSPSAWSD